jgi:hypothetical protein
MLQKIISLAVLRNLYHPPHATTNNSDNRPRSNTHNAQWTERDSITCLEGVTPLKNGNDTAVSNYSKTKVPSVARFQAQVKRK